MHATRIAAVALLAAAAIGAIAPRRGAYAGQNVWRPRPTTTWQWQITGVVDLSVPAQLFDVDLFDAQPAGGSRPRPSRNALTWVSYPRGAYVGPTVTPPGDAANPGVIEQLHARGRKVVCYMDSGAWESYRPDARLFPRSVIGASTGWSGERWLDIRRRSWPLFEWIVVDRMRLAAASGCDGIEPDQNNPVGNHPGFPITSRDERAWYLEVARDAHALGLSVFMKNGIELLPDTALVSAFDGDITEQCFQYRECSGLRAFVRAGKWVGEVEYKGSLSRLCPVLQRDGFMAMKKKPALDAWRSVCW